MPRHSAIPALVAALLLSGCASSPPVSYYGLTAVTAAAAAGTGPAGSRVLELGPMQIPEYLDRPQLVTRAPGNELRVDELHRWAEPLEDALPRTVALDLDRRLPDVVVVEFPSSQALHTDYRVAGRVSRFDADTAGEAVLELQWLAWRADGPATPPRRSRYAVPVADPASAGSQVAALNAALAAFGEELAAAVAALGDQSPP